MEEIKNEEQVVVTTQSNSDENNSQNTEGAETKKPFKKRKPKPKTPKDPQALQQAKGEGWVTDLKKAYILNKKAVDSHHLRARCFFQSSSLMSGSSGKGVFK